MPREIVTLTAREYAVARGLAHGFTTRELARRRVVHVDTIASQRTTIYRKMWLACDELHGDYSSGDQDRTYEYAILLVLWFRSGQFEEGRISRKLFSSPQ